MDYLEMENEGTEVLEKLISQFLRPGMKVAEIGCGSSTLIQEIERRYKVYGICIDPYGYGERIIPVPAENMHEIGEKFDVIYLVRSLHHLRVVDFSQSAYLSLKRGGKIIIVDWKKGVKTGVRENYFSLHEALSFFKHFAVVDKGEGIWNFYLVVEKA